MQLTNMAYQELAIKPGHNNSKISLALEVAPYFGIKKQDAEKIIQSIHATVHQNLNSILDQHNANISLKARVKTCLLRQEQIIFPD